VLVAGGLTWAYIAASGNHSCGITTSGVAYCWGDNTFGQLGIGSTAGPQVFPQPVVGGLTFAAIAVGANNHTCGITTSGQAYCWGDNGFGKLGDGTFSQRTAPTPVVGGLLFTAIRPNFFHSTCALATDSRAYCFGLNDRGQLGLGGGTDTGGHPVPAAVTGGLTFSAIGTGFNQSCGVSTSGPAYCWGGNNAGQLGNGTTTLSTVPVLVSGGFSYTDVSGGNGFSLASRPPHTCGVSTTGVGLCWGFNGDGELGNGTNNNTFLTPQVVVGGLQFVHVIGGDGASIGLTSSGLVYQWGTTPAIVPDPL
jgi:alpha-tubulin suppressor-like RCC1 family protein